MYTDIFSPVGMNAGSVFPFSSFASPYHNTIRASEFNHSQTGVAGGLIV